MTARYVRCPCTIAPEPCMPRCTCVMPGSSSGCLCCARYGSEEQVLRKAEALVATARGRLRGSELLRAGLALERMWREHGCNAETVQAFRTAAQKYEEALEAAWQVERGQLPAFPPVQPGAGGTTDGA